MVYPKAYCIYILKGDYRVKLLIRGVGVSKRHSVLQGFIRDEIKKLPLTSGSPSRPIRKTLSLIIP